MFRNIAIAAAILAGSMSSQASANHLGSNFGSDCGAWFDESCFGPRGFSQWREDEFGFRTSCEDAKDIVRERGYRKVRAAQCGVRVHKITGWRNGHRYLIKINGYNGNIGSIVRIN